MRCIRPVGRTGWVHSKNLRDNLESGILPQNFQGGVGTPIMAKHVIQSKQGAPPRGAYSQGWRAGDFVFVTGTGPLDPSTGQIVGEDIERQTEQTIDNIAAVLQAD